MPEKEASPGLAWEAIEINDQDSLIGELVEFWSHQSAEDIRSRFYSLIDSESLAKRYRHALKHTRFALTLRDNGRLVGLALGTVSPHMPDWVSLSMEIDAKHRNRGYGTASLETIYQLALANGYSGTVAEALSENYASHAAIAKFRQGKPHSVSYQRGVIAYYIGDQSNVPVSLDLL